MIKFYEIQNMSYTVTRVVSSNYEYQNKEAGCSFILNGIKVIRYYVTFKCTFVSEVRKNKSSRLITNSVSNVSKCFQSLFPILVIWLYVGLDVSEVLMGLLQKSNVWL